MIQFPQSVVEIWESAAGESKAEERMRAKLSHDTRVEQEVDKLRLRHEAKEMFQRELDEANTPPLEMYSLAEYRRNPEKAPEDLISGVLKKDGLCVVLGPSKSGKSTLALQMSHSLMTGTDFLGQSVKKTDGGVGLVSYDMDAGMLMDWIDGAPGIDENKVFTVNAHRRGNPLGVKGQRAKIAGFWKQQKVDIVVVDSFSASFFGADQNDAVQVMAHYRDLKEFALTEVGASVLIVIVHSTEGKQKVARGSSAHTDTADTIVAVSVDDKTDQRTVSVEKYRGVRGATKMTPIIITAPDVATHLVDVDAASMLLAGLAIPPSIVASAAFPPLEDRAEEPDVEPYFDPIGDDDL